MYLRANPDSVTLHQIPDGPSGIHQTLVAMAELSRQYRKHPDIRILATEVVSAAPEKHYRAQAELLFNFVRDEIRYVHDINGVETLASPDITLALGSGDCDDKATLLSALLESVGHRTRFVALGLTGGDFEHVIVETKIGNRWVPADTTERVALGWYPPGVTSRMVVYA